jgi:hypothetical protein
MAIPEQVQKELDRAEEFLKTEATPNEGAPTQGDQGSKAPEQVGEDSPVATDVPESVETPTSTATQDADVSTIHQGREADTTQQSEESPELRLLRQQHSTLQGMFNSERRTHRESQEQLSAQVQELRTALGNVQQQAPQPQAEQPSAPAASLFTKDEEEEYSPGFVSMMNRVIDQKLSPIYNGLNQVAQGPQQALGQMNRRVDQVAQTQEQQAQEGFFNNLASAVPDWEQINGNPKFNSWLQQVDPISGISTQVFLDDARDRLELGRVVSVFNTFKQSLGVAGTVQDAQTAASTSSLHEQAVVPTNRSAGNPQANAGQAKSYTRSDLTRLYADELGGKYKGKEDVFRERERELLQAINTGHYT